MPTRLTMRAPFNSSINVTPLIDVLLVLLVIFMVVQLSAPKHLAVTVPAAAQSGPGNPEVVLELTAAGGYSLNGAPVTAGTLASRLAAVYGGRPRSVLFIKTAPNRRYQEFIEAADVARGAGVSIIGFAPNQ